MSVIYEYKRLFKLLGLAFASLFLYAFFCILFLYIAFNPSELKFTNANGEQSIHTQYIKFDFISLNKIPQSCKDAILATEDKDFYTNLGIDWNGLGRMLVTPLLNQNYSGGSTITEQVVKLGHQNIYNRGFAEKVIEIVDALKLTHLWSKDKILEVYLNNIYLGNYNYGIESASEDYFRKNTSELDLAQCAFLAGLPQAPEVYNPNKDLKQGLDRQKTVLSLMLQNGVITQSEYLKAVGEPLNFHFSN